MSEIRLSDGINVRVKESGFEGKVSGSSFVNSRWHYDIRHVHGLTMFQRMDELEVLEGDDVLAAVGEDSYLGSHGLNWKYDGSNAPPPFKAEEGDSKFKKGDRAKAYVEYIGTVICSFNYNNNVYYALVFEGDDYPSSVNESDLELIDVCKECGREKEDV